MKKPGPSLLLVFLALVLPVEALSQIISPEPTNSTVCPDERIIYTVHPSPYAGCGTYTWTVTNGSFRFGSDLTTTTTKAPSVDVFWKDVPETGTLTVKSNCSEGGALNVTAKYAIASLNGRVPANPRITGRSGALPFCSTDLIQVAVDIMFLNNTGKDGVSLKRADGYEWSIPSGWSFEGAAGPRIVRTQSEFISITPVNGCSGGSVAVKAFMDCSSGRKYSNSASISLERRFNPNITVPSGYTGPKCGIRSPVEFTATHYQCAVSYRWTATGTGWTHSSGSQPWITASNTIELQPQGDPTDDGLIAVEIDLGCRTVRQTYRAVYTDPPPPAPAVTASNGSQPLCIGDAITFTSTPHPDVQTWVGFDWFATGGLLVNGVSASSSSPVKTYDETATITVPSGTPSGFAYVYARLNQGRCAPSAYGGTIKWVGVISSSQFSISGPTTVCPNTVQSYSSTFIDPSITNYQWAWSGGFSSSSGQGTPYLDVYVPSNFTSGSITLRLGNRCGLTGSPAYVVVYSGSCYGNYSFTASPNPANRKLTVTASEAEGEDTSAKKKDRVDLNKITFALINEKLEKVKTGKVANGKLEWDTSELPNGNYYLHIIQPDQVFLYRILINH